MQSSKCVLKSQGTNVKVTYISGMFPVTSPSPDDPERSSSISVQGWRERNYTPEVFSKLFLIHSPGASTDMKARMAVRLNLTTKIKTACEEEQ
jgi:hypothetical protein